MIKCIYVTAKVWEDTSHSLRVQDQNSSTTNPEEAEATDKWTLSFYSSDADNKTKWVEELVWQLNLH